MELWKDVETLILNQDHQKNIMNKYPLADSRAVHEHLRGLKNHLRENDLLRDPCSPDEDNQNRWLRDSLL